MHSVAHALSPTGVMKDFDVLQIMLPVEAIVKAGDRLALSTVHTSGSPPDHPYHGNGTVGGSTQVNSMEFFECS